MHIQYVHTHMLKNVISHLLHEPFSLEILPTGDGNNKEVLEDRIVVLVDGLISKKVVGHIEMVAVTKEVAEVEIMMDFKVATKTTPGAFREVIKEKVVVEV